MRWSSNTGFTTAASLRLSSRCRSHGSPGPWGRCRPTCHPGDCCSGVRLSSGGLPCSSCRHRGGQAGGGRSSRRSCTPCHLCSGGSPRFASGVSPFSASLGASRAVSFGGSHVASRYVSLAISFWRVIRCLAWRITQLLAWSISRRFAWHAAPHLPRVARRIT